MDSEISTFRGKWTRLSNFAICSIWYEGHIYPSVEHAYQGAKTLDLEERGKIRNLATPNQAKKEGKKVHIREDWETIKIDIMASLLREKFSQEPDRGLLVSTGNANLIEGNWWGDTFWGQCPLGIGENWLGRLLMSIRSEIK